MKHFLWLFLVGAAYAQITTQPTGSGGLCSVLANTQCITTSTATVNVGDTIIAVSASNVNTNNPTPSGCNQTWPAANRFTGTGFAGSIWIIPHATAAATGCGITLTTQATFTSFAWHIYSNVLSVGTPQIDNTASTGTTMSAPPMAATSVGSFIVGMLLQTTANNDPITVVAGTRLRRSSGVGGARVFIGDTEATSVGQQITIGATAGISTTYRKVVVELVPTPTNRKAALSDQMHTVLMNALRNMNWELHPSELSSTWCTWFMPINLTHVYGLEPEASHQLNGQASDLHVPPWQMTRICQDASGNFWASPPLLAGTGISIAPSATGITISSTSGAGDMKFIAGGTTTFPGTVQVAAADCATLLTTTEAAVVDTDAVTFSLRTGPSPTNWSLIRFYPIVSNGSIAWRGCNTGTTAITPGARDINWYVARRAVTAVVHRPVHPRGKKK